MESEELRLSYHWHANQYTIGLSFLSFLVFVLYMVYLSHIQEDWRWMLLALPGLTALPGTIFDFYWCVYKAPRLIEIKGDTVDIEMRTNERFTISLFDIERLEYMKRFLDWSIFNVRIVSSSKKREWLVSSQYMRNVDALILMLRDRNPNCKIDEVLLEAIARKSRRSRQASYSQHELLTYLNPSVNMMSLKLNYLPFVLGVILLGGFIVLPFLFISTYEMNFLDSLPWTLAFSVVFVLSFKLDGSISWLRAIVAVLLFVVANEFYCTIADVPSFSTVIAFALLSLLVSGYLGIVICRFAGL